MMVLHTGYTMYHVTPAAQMRPERLSLQRHSREGRVSAIQLMIHLPHRLIRDSAVFLRPALMSC
jgi:hypothetical protein